MVVIADAAISSYNGEAKAINELSVGVAPTKPIGHDRAEYWAFCKRIAFRTRAAKQRVCGTLTAHDIDRMFVDQRWCCAVSGVRFDLPAKGAHGKRLPFGPSIDRVDPAGRYEHGNIRLVCNIVNLAMNEWGEAALHKLVAIMGAKS